MDQSATDQGIFRSVAIHPMDADTVISVSALETVCFPDPWSIRSLRDELKNPLAVYYTALLGARVVGYAGMHHIVDEGHITKIAVHPEQRRQGVGSLMIEALLRCAKERGMRLLTLEVRASNDAAVALYEHLGFVSLGRRCGYYSRPKDDAVIMTAVLD